MEQPKGIIVKYTADKMRAFVALSGNFGQVTANAVMAELLRKGVVHGLNAAVIRALGASPVYDKFVEVARGTPPRPGADGRVEILVPEPSGALCDFVVVKEGDALARRVPPVPGAPGMDVFGNAIEVPPAGDARLAGGAGAVAPPGGADLLVAEYAGAVERSRDGAIGVRPYKEINGDVGAGTGDVSFAGDVLIAGAVRPGFAVDAAGSLLVAGDIEGARIKCGGDLAMRSGARGASSIECGGSVEAARLENVTLSAEGGVTVRGEIVNSNIAARGAVKAGAILGGSVSAVCGITAARIGGECRSRTVLDIGVVYRYAEERDSLKNDIDTQNVLAEGYTSELYCFVRDSMDEYGFIAEEKMPDLEAHVGNLTGSLAARRECENGVRELTALLKSAAGCSVTAGEVHPNVLLRLGFSEQSVGEVMKNVHLKPVGAEKI